MRPKIERRRGGHVHHVAVNRVVQRRQQQPLRRGGCQFVVGPDVRPTAPSYPQSNGKIERWHKSLKGECIRPGTPLSPEVARRLIGQYVEHYNAVRLHSAIGYVTPADMLAGRQTEIHAARDRKLEEARRQRQLRRQQAA